MTCLGQYDIREKTNSEGPAFKLCKKRSNGISLSTTIHLFHGSHPAMVPFNSESLHTDMKEIALDN